MKFYKLLNAIFASALLLSCFQPNRADVNGGTECAGKWGRWIQFKWKKIGLCKIVITDL